MPFPTGHLQENPLPPGVVGALSLAGYQLLADVAGVGAARIGQQAFLLIAADPDPGRPSEVTHISFHNTRLGGQPDATAYQQLAAQLGALRLSGYVFALERAGLRSKLRLVDPGTGAIVLQIPEKHPGGLFGGGPNVSALLETAKRLPQAGAAPDLQNPELLQQSFLAMALRDDSIDGEDAADLADRALTIATTDSTLSPAVAFEQAKAESGLGQAPDPNAPPPPPREPPQFA